MRNVLKLESRWSVETPPHTPAPTLLIIYLCHLTGECSQFCYCVTPVCSAVDHEGSLPREPVSNANTRTEANWKAKSYNLASKSVHRCFTLTRRGSPLVQGAAILFPRACGLDEWIISSREGGLWWARLLSSHHVPATAESFQLSCHVHAGCAPFSWCRTVIRNRPKRGNCVWLSTHMQMYGNVGYK